ncbi:MAG: glycosyltransferase, partial [Actinobacteria bacterium]|nr:glycosyltransferase [Actinomycetota bacterium]
GEWLEETLLALDSLDYPDVTTLVIDDGSRYDPTPRIAEVAPRAFVRRRESSSGFATAANEVIASVQGATFLLFCHGDAVLDRYALKIMVDEAVRSNAGIVGPKVVRSSDRSHLLEVGMTVDRLGAPHTEIEPDEIDQEQHDAVRDVFFISGVAMLVRSDLFAEIGGFDPDAAPAAEDVDFGWRARIAGARVMVAPDAVVTHSISDIFRDCLDANPSQLEGARHRAMLTSAGALSLLWMVPLAMGLSLIEAGLSFVSGHRGRATAIVKGWWIALTGIRSGRPARLAAQSHRRVSDGEIRYLQSHGSSRVRRFLNGTLHADDRLRDITERSRTLTDTAGARVREPVGIAVCIFVALVAIGSRDLLLGSLPQIGQMRIWPSVGGGWGAFTSVWRDSLLGARTLEPPLLLVTSGIGSIFFGATGLARTLLVVVAMPVGVIGAWRLGRSVAGPGIAAVVTGVAYGVIPLPRNAIAAGRMGPLLAYAIAPLLVLGIARLCGLLEAESRPRRRIVSLCVLLAICSAWWMPAIALPLAIAAAFTIAAPFTRGAGVTLGWRPATKITLGALALLLPWPITLIGLHNGATLGFSYSGSAKMLDLLRFHTGPAGAGAAGWVLLAVALVVLLIASGPRFEWAVRAWGLMIVGFAAAWIPQQISSTIPMPVREGLLVPAAVGLALAVGLGAASLLTDVGRRRFGWRQVSAVLATLALLLPALAFAADTLGGRWRMPRESWADSLSWMESRSSAGDFRVLWLGDPSVLPLDPGRSGSVGYGVTSNGVSDARVLIPIPERGEQRLVRQAVETLRRGGSNRIGAQLGALGVRFILVPETPGPDQRPFIAAPDGITSTLADQLDLLRLEASPGLSLYEVVPWQPVRALITTEAGANVVVPLQSGKKNPAGIVRFATPKDSMIKAKSNGKTLKSEGDSNWDNSWVLPKAGPVSIVNSAAWLRIFAVLLQGAIFLLAIRMWRSDSQRAPKKTQRRRVAGSTLPPREAVASDSLVLGSSVVLDSAVSIDSEVALDSSVSIDSAVALDNAGPLTPSADSSSTETEPGT